MHAKGLLVRSSREETKNRPDLHLRLSQDPGIDNIRYLEEETRKGLDYKSV